MPSSLPYVKKWCPIEDPSFRSYLRDPRRDECLDKYDIPTFHVNMPVKVRDWDMHRRRWGAWQDAVVHAGVRVRWEINGRAGKDVEFKYREATVCVRTPGGGARLQGPYSVELGNLWMHTAHVCPDNQEPMVRFVDMFKVYALVTINGGERWARATLVDHRNPVGPWDDNAFRVKLHAASSSSSALVARAIMQFSEESQIVLRNAGQRV